MCTVSFPGLDIQISFIVLQLPIGFSAATCCMALRSNTGYILTVPATLTQFVHTYSAVLTLSRNHLTMQCSEYLSVRSSTHEYIALSLSKLTTHLLGSLTFTKGAYSWMMKFKCVLVINRRCISSHHNTISNMQLSKINLDIYKFTRSCLKCKNVNNNIFLPK